jgi:hypothetical protein
LNISGIKLKQNILNGNNRFLSVHVVMWEKKNVGYVTELKIFEAA